MVWRWWSGGWLRGFVFAGGGPVWAAFVPGVRLLAGLSEAAVIVVVMGFRDCLTGLKAGLLADRRAVAGGRIGALGAGGASERGGDVVGGRFQAWLTWRRAAAAAAVAGRGGGGGWG